MKDYYIYFVLDTRKPCFVKNGYELPHEPIYVGKGSGDRYKGKNCRSIVFKNKINKMITEGFVPKYVKIGGFTENEAFVAESEMIRLLGRRDLNEGPLLNLTDGGTSGHKKSDETKKKISQAHLGTKKPWTSDFNIRTKKGVKTGKPAWNTDKKCPSISEGIYKARGRKNEVTARVS